MYSTLYCHTHAYKVVCETIKHEYVKPVSRLIVNVRVDKVERVGVVKSELDGE